MFAPLFLMHAPDGFFSVPIAALMWVLTGSVLAFALRRANATLNEKAVPLMGVMAAFIFAAQMFNFQVASGTSGHLLGGVLAGVLLGPWAGTVVMACVVAVQGVVFQDGGLVVMGANIFNMGIIGTLGGYVLYRGVAWVLGGESRGRMPAAAIAAWVSVEAAAVAVALQLAASDTTSLKVALPAMVGVHALIGIGEAVITVAALSFIAKTRGDLLGLRGGSAAAPEGAEAGRPAWQRLWWVGGLGVALLVVVVLAPLASSNPDGLEKVAEDKGFIESAKDSGSRWFGDYSVPGLEGNTGTVVSGVIGVLVVAGAMGALAPVLARRRRHPR